MTFQNIYDERIENLISEKKNLQRGEYENCRFANCDFSSADLSAYRFIECTFSECDLSNARLLDTSFQEVAFISCKMQGLFFPDCNSFGFDVTCDNCQLDYAVFREMNLKKMKIAGSQLRSVDFSGANLQRAIIQRCDLRDATFEQTNLEEADFRDSCNYVIHPDRNRVKGARFSLPEVVGLLSVYGIRVDMA